MCKLVTLLIAALLMMTGLTVGADAPVFTPGSWTLVIMPDTQYYFGDNAGVFTNQTQWIRDNARARNIKYVLHEGDVTGSNKPAQWENAKAAMAVLGGVVPYAMVPGNHDCEGDRQSLLSTYFLDQTKGMPTFGGTYEPGNLNNNYHLFSAGGRDWIVIGLEWAPRDAVITWANGLLETHSKRSAILVTHAYLNNDSTRYDWATKGNKQQYNPHYYNSKGAMSGGVNDGEEIWQKLAKLHKNVVFVFNGHVLGDGVGRLTSTGEHGNEVHQILANYQYPIQREHGGDGYLRLLEFHPDGKTVQVYTYSPFLNKCLTDDEQQFVLSIAPVKSGATKKIP